MKTQNNNQETGKNQVSKMVLYSSAIILSVVLIGKTTKAQNLWDHLSNYKSDSKTVLMAEPSTETKQADAAFEIIDAELNTQLNNSNWSVGADEPSLNSFEYEMEATLEYNPAKFVEAEMESEIARMENSNESAEAESTRQIELLMNEIQYNADKFAEQEMELEIENERVNEELLKSEETTTSVEAEQAIDKYATKIILAEETGAKYAAGGSETNVNSFTGAELLTANSSNAEIAKYADKTIQAVEANDETVAGSTMTNANSFTTAELLTARGTSQEIAKYADKTVQAVAANDENATKNEMTVEEDFNYPVVLISESTL